MGLHADEWAASITDPTPLFHRVHALVQAGDLKGAARLLPEERPYPLAEQALSHLCPVVSTG